MSVTTSSSGERRVSASQRINPLPPPATWPHATPTVTRRPLDLVAADIAQVERSYFARIVKRSVDVLLSGIGIVLLAPIFVALAIVVRATSRGPAIFVQKRVGLHGRKFRFYKFRTMVADAERRRAELEHLNEMNGPVFKIKSDPRVTRVGAVLRKYSLDELPQLWNVLKGDMSLVGPRPPLPAEVELYTSRQAQRLSVTPGITGLWQVSGRSSLADFDHWLELDLEYVRKQSLWVDVKILCKTVGVVVGARGAH